MEAPPKIEELETPFYSRLGKQEQRIQFFKNKFNTIKNRPVKPRNLVNNGITISSLDDDNRE
jgi:hypothetical protein